MEHDFNRAYDLLQRSHHPHRRNARLAGQVIEQNSNQNQDRAQLENAQQIPASCVLHSQGTGRTGHAFNGPHFDPPGRSEILEADRTGNHSFQSRHVARGRPTHSQPLQIHPDLGLRVRGQPESLGRVCDQATRSKGSKQKTDA